MQFGDGPGESYKAFISQVGAIAMGATTYEWVLANEIFKDPNKPKSWPYQQPTWVFTTRSLPTVPGAEIKFASGDVSDVHNHMIKAVKEKNIWIVGGGDLVGQFYDKGLLDELILTVAPVTLGSGAPLLPRSITSPALHLVSCKAIQSSFIELRYTISKDTPTGS